MGEVLLRETYVCGYNTHRCVRGVYCVCLYCVHACEFVDVYNVGMCGGVCALCSSVCDCECLSVCNVWLCVHK